MNFVILDIFWVVKNVFDFDGRRLCDFETGWSRAYTFLRLPRRCGVLLYEVASVIRFWRLAVNTSAIDADPIVAFGFKKLAYKVLLDSSDTVLICARRGLLLEFCLTGLLIL